MLPETFFVGANYWASHAGTFMWRNWNEESVDRDFAVLRQNGMRVLRIFPLWPDFQKLTVHRASKGIHREFRYGEDPLPDTDCGQAAVDPEMLRRFHTLCRLAEKHGLKLIVALVTGWMSGRLYAPAALEHRNLITDPAAVLWEIRYVRCLVESLKNETAVIAWDWGNECNNLGENTDEEMALWGYMMTSAVKLADPERPVISGLHECRSEFFRNIGEVCDILTTHPYPAFTPHCQVDALTSFRSAFHAACQTRWMADMGRKPAFVEEIGSFGPTFCSEETASAYAENALWNCFAHGCGGVLWWCAFDQSRLEQTPYDWQSMERELGLLTADRLPKSVIRTMASFGSFASGMSLPPPRTDAVLIQGRDGDHWGTAYMAFLLAKQAGFDLRFYDGTGSLPESRCYLLPSAEGTEILDRHIYLELLERVRNGAVLYYSTAYCGIQPFEGFGVEIESVSEADSPGTVLFEKSKPALSVKRKFAVRTRPGPAKILARDEENRPVFTEAVFGKGKLLFLAVPLESSLMDTPGSFGEGAPDYAAVYRQIAGSAGIRRIFTSPDPMVTVTEHPVSEKAAYLVLVNNSGSAKNLKLHLASPWTVVSSSHGKIKADSILIPAHSGTLLTLKK